MQCPNCEAPIEEVGESVCPNCGLELSQPVFLEDDPEVDTHSGQIFTLQEYREARGALSDSQAVRGNPYRATLGEQVLIDEDEAAHPVVLRHPSTGRKLKPIKFFVFGVNLRGKEHHFWVRATAKTPAVEALLNWIRKEKGWRPLDAAGQEFPWGLDGTELAIKYKHEMPLIGEYDGIPPDEDEYLDAYYRDKPIMINMRTQANERV